MVVLFLRAATIFSLHHLARPAVLSLSLLLNPHLSSWRRLAVLSLHHLLRPSLCRVSTRRHLSSVVEEVNLLVVWLNVPARLLGELLPVLAEVGPRQEGRGVGLAQQGEVYGTWNIGKSAISSRSK